MTILFKIESTGIEVVLSNTHSETGKCQGCFHCHYLQTSLDVFGHLQVSSDVFMSHSQVKNLAPITQKKLAGVNF